MTREQISALAYEAHETAIEHIQRALDIRSGDVAAAVKSVPRSSAGVATIKVAIPHRWRSKPVFVAEIDAKFETAALGVKIGLAVKAAYSTGAVLTGAVLTGAVLTRAVLTGAVLTDADLTGAVLTRAVLTRAVLTRAVLTRAVLTDADLTGAVLTDADLTGAVLTRAVLTRAVLTGAVLRGVPVVPNIDAAILAAISAGGKLDMSTWHHCETRHCRAGWAITLAGAGGAALEFAMGPAAAGALIYAASRPGKPIPNFYARDAAAMEDLKACAAEAAKVQP